MKALIAMVMFVIAAVMYAALIAASDEDNLWGLDDDRF